MATEILDFLYLGNDEDAEQRFKDGKWKVLDVSDEQRYHFRYISTDTPNEKQIPILYEYDGKWHLDWNKVFEAGDWIEKTHIEHPYSKLLVHCAAGQERSPLVVQYYLVRYHNMTTTQAINYIKERRPQVFRCDKDYLW